MEFDYKDFFENKKGIIFDCDGVIINSRDANVRFYNIILEKLELPPMDKSQEDYVHSHTVYESIKHIVPPILFEEAINIGKKISYLSVIDLIKLEDGLIDFISILKKKNKKLAINTNRTNTMPIILNNFQLKSFFDPVVTADSVKNPKPHPESIYYILKRWNLKPYEVLFIGDSKVDEKTAKSVPVDFISYKNHDLNSIANIENFNQIVNLLT
ncbi:HAD family hydrolase [Desulfothermus okinawensis JCM 13304]